MLLAQGTGAQWAQVWLAVSDRLTLGGHLARGRPTDGRPPPPCSPAAWTPPATGRRALAVRHGGQLLGVLRLQERPGLALTAVEERLFAGLAAQAGLVLRLVGLRAELEGRHEELVARADELKASRERLIETQDAERRRLERDIHDGAQQHLVALTVNLRLAQTIAIRSPERAARVLAEQADAARCRDRDALLAVPRDLPEAARRRRSGAGPAVRGRHQRDPGHRRTRSPARLPAAVEAALYFCCMEAVQNAAKHSGARRRGGARSASAQGRCRLTVMDDGTGFDPGTAVASGRGRRAGQHARPAGRGRRHGHRRVDRPAAARRSPPWSRGPSVPDHPASGPVPDPGRVG